MVLKVVVIIPLILVLFSRNFQTYSLSTTIRQVNYSVPIEDYVNEDIEYILEFSKLNQIPTATGPPRISVTTNNASTNSPLMISSRQPKELLSWKLPLAVESVNGEQYYKKTARTLCYDILKHSKLSRYKELEHDNPIVTVATGSSMNIHFKVTVDFPDYFELQHSTQYSIKVSPSEPQYFFYNFSSYNPTANQNSNYDTVILEVSSNDTICTIVSIQNVSCPVFDLNQDITFRGFYETFTTKGGITIPKYKFPFGFYVVFVAQADDYQCSRVTEPSSGDRIKNITLVIKPSISYNDYVYAGMLTLSAIGGFYIIFVFAFFFCSRRNCVPRQMEFAVATESINSRGITAPNQPPVSATECAGNEFLDSESIDEREYDYIEEVETSREIRLGRTHPCLADLARTHPKILIRRSNLYLYNVLTVALFYGLPVVQLVIIYQRVLNETGEQDLCYYNFLCSHPLGFLSDFNHVFSNVGYILLGILFLFITYHRELSHVDQDFDRQFGIPQHYGMFYAMGVALMMEGILSGSYHVCPSQTNFQFDTSFMYVMAVLCMVKLYQNRHPDINASAYTTFGVLAIAILFGMIGILENTEGFWIFFVTLYILLSIYLSIKIYYFGLWKLNIKSFQNIGRIVRHDFISGPLNVLKPCYKARFVMLVLGNLCNWALATYALWYHPKNFAVFLLLIFMSNTLLYFFFYIAMKYVHKENVKLVTWIFLFSSSFCAVSAMYFFLHKAISWSKTPAQSRTFNVECKLLRFYDYHDIWHFLSAIGMFFTFMVLLTLDDDLSHKHRTTIPVF